MKDIDVLQRYCRVAGINAVALMALYLLTGFTLEYEVKNALVVSTIALSLFALLVAILQGAGRRYRLAFILVVPIILCISAWLFMNGYNCFVPYMLLLLSLKFYIIK